MGERRDEFYVGYLPRAPRGIAMRTRVAVAVVVAAGLAAAVLLTVGQSRFDPGVFEFGVDRDFEGVVVERPYPLLAAPDGTDYLLVAPGKHGAGTLVAGLGGRNARVTGSRIDNGRESAIEVHRVEALPAEAAPTPDERRLGRRTLRGEIVDSKCHLGVMKPGRGKPHRACAILCIRGGIPPLLRVEDRAGAVSYLLLVGPDGRSINREVLDYVADPVEVTGEVVRSGSLLVLYADPADIRRL